MEHSDQAVELNAAEESIADARPVLQTERFASLDVLRGFALLGILLLNIKLFAMINEAYMNPTAYGDLSGLNYWIWYFQFLLGDMKLMNIFSMLFGAGIVLMTTRSEARTGRSASVHYKRMGWLAVIGLLHAHVIWHGDILFMYAACGLLVYLFRHCRPMTLIIVAVPTFLISIGLGLLFYWWSFYWPQEAVDGFKAGWSPSPVAIEEQLAAFRGGWLDQAPIRSTQALIFELPMLIFIGPRVVGLMLLGMALFKLGVVTAACTTRAYVTMLIAGAVIGLPLIAWHIHLDETGGWEAGTSMFRNFQINGIASVFVSFAYIAGVMLLCRHVRCPIVGRAFAAVGQMALTNYLMHSIVCTLIFYGHGFGYYGYFDRTEQLLTVLAVWVFQLIASPLWLMYFRFGPFEWLWRSLTYWKRQPFRRATPIISP